ncbi:hypothetical protein H5983_06035 [Faecalitalea cylindroides]|uniref:hypothetical protein n=1 Tax=Faecalitalea cylindroides TaxID=39483 RepID=UPI001958D29A|nr:hypothetical protein [Faecalitalea cylindroides]MBM6810622.1 hypothetical protein [Faecalitalea cylindroides]
MFDFFHRLLQQNIEQEQQTNELESLNRLTENYANEAMHQAENAANFAEDCSTNFFDNNMFGGGFGDNGMF